MEEKAESGRRLVKASFFQKVLYPIQTETKNTLIDTISTVNAFLTAGSQGQQIKAISETRCQQARVRIELFVIQTSKMLQNGKGGKSVFGSLFARHLTYVNV